jgi:hypothetical protein
MDLLIDGLLEYGRLGALTPSREWVEPGPLLPPADPGLR